MPANPVTFRPFSMEEDIPRLLCLRLAIEAADQEGADNREETLLRQLAMPGHDPAHDRLVAADEAHPETLIGYNLTWLPPETDTALLNVLIHPAWRRQGIGSSLMEAALQRARQLGARQAVVYAHQKHPASGAFLRKHGFGEAGAYTELRAPADGHLPLASLPQGYQVRTYAEVQDLALLTQAMNECYEGLPGHQRASQAQMAEWLPEFNQEGLFLLFDEAGCPAGISRVEPSAERSAQNGRPTGYIDAPGVSLPHRHLELYRALLLTGMQWLQTQGVSLIEMESWGDRQEVLRGYTELGFTILRQVITYQLNIDKD